MVKFFEHLMHPLFSYFGDKYELGQLGFAQDELVGQHPAITKWTNILWQHIFFLALLTPRWAASNFLPSKAEYWSLSKVLASRQHKPSARAASRTRKLPGRTSIFFVGACHFAKWMALKIHVVVIQIRSRESVEKCHKTQPQPRGQEWSGGSGGSGQ